MREPTNDEFLAAHRAFNDVAEELDVEMVAHKPIQGEGMSKVFAYRMAKAALTAERDALREQVARVEALRVGWRDEGVGLGASALLSDCADDLDAALHPTDGAS